MGICLMVASLTAVASGSPALAAPVARPATIGAAILSDTIPQPVKARTAVDLGLYAPGQTLRVVLGLRVPHPAEEEALLKDLQDRSSPLYHHYLTAAQWNARFAPSPAEQQAVVSWARTQGLQVTQTYADRLLVDTAGSVSAYQRAFGVTIKSYRSGTRTFFANASAIVVPAEISASVQSVNGLDNYREVTSASHTSGRGAAEPAAAVYSAGAVVASGRAAHRSASATSPRVGVTPKAATASAPLYSGLISPLNLWSSDGYDEAALYAQGHCCDPDGTVGQSSLAATIAISTAGAFDGNDLAAYAQNCCSYVNGTTLAYNVQPWYIDGTPGCCGLETTLDVESAVAEANSFGCYCTTAKVNVYEGANAGLGTFEDVDNVILSQNSTRVFSTSWGLDEGSTGGSTMNSFHNIFNAMAGQGWTMNAAAGDSGSYDNGSSLSVDYPASDPDIVASGGSELHLNSDGTYNHETTWNSGGGGCSSYWAKPSWQSGLSTGCGSRALPDISLNASNNTAEVLWFDGGTLGATSSLYSVWGTSEVAPELAGFWAVMNSYLLSRGNQCGSGGTGACAPLGDMHTVLYLEAESTGGGRAAHYPVYDITTGNNDNGHGTGSYAAGPGFDLATGWGSVNALELSRAFNWEGIYDYNGPIVSFTNPAPDVWYNSDQEISWTVSDPIQAGDVVASGVSGFTQGWDSIPSDPFRDTTPGDGDSYYSGPEFPNATSGYMFLSWAGQGCHTAYVEAWDNVGYPSGVRSPGYFCYDTSTPSAALKINGGATYTKSTNASLTVTASNPLGGDPITAMRFSTDGVNYGPWNSYATSASVTLPTGDGSKTVYVEVENAAGTISPAGSNSIILDQTPPKITKAPTPSIRLGVLSPSGAGITVSWNATDTTSGVKSYQLQEQVNGGAWGNVALSKPTATSVNLTLPTGHKYDFRIAATDNAGNTSAYTTAAAFTLSLYQENSAAVKYSTGWTRHLLSGSSGGSVDFTQTAGATATLTFTGAQVAWVSTLGSTRGAATVTLDAGPAKTVNTHAINNTTADVVFTVTAAEATHKLVIKNSATSGSPRIDVDAFVVIG
jgi:kumamolisin